MKKFKGNIMRYVQFIFGMFLFSFAFQFFLAPNNLVFGGVTGLSIVFENLFSWDPSLFVLIVSIFLLIVSLIFLGKDKTAGSVLGSLLLPLFLKGTELLALYIDVLETEVLLATIFGGVLAGLGMGFVYKSGFTTGGTDIINQILHKYLKISLGNAMFFSDGLIVLLNVFMFGISNFMYSTVVLYVMTLLIDKVVLGISSSKAFYIVTNRVDEVRNYILLNLGHGVTIFDAIGGFSKEDQKVLFCVIPTNQYFKLKEGIHKIDKSSFFVVTDAYEVFGGE